MSSLSSPRTLVSPEFIRDPLTHPGRRFGQAGPQADAAAAFESGRWRWLGVLLLLAGLLVLLLSGQEASGATDASGSCAGAVVPACAG